MEPLPREIVNLQILPTSSQEVNGETRRTSIFLHRQEIWELPRELINLQTFTRREEIHMIPNELINLPTFTRSLDPPETKIDYKIKNNKIPIEETEDEDLQCIVCVTNKKNCRVDCGHLYCITCISKLNPKKCPMCRKDFSDFVCI